MTPTPRDRCMAALAEIDRYYLDDTIPPDDAYSELGAAMHALFGPLPDERIFAALRELDGEEGDL